MMKSTSGPDPYFTEPYKQRKLEEAIRRGYIIKVPMNKHIFKYILTPFGFEKWMSEK